MCVCVCACVCVCVLVCLLLEYPLYRCVLDEGKCLFSNNIVFSWIGFHLKRFVQKLWQKNYFFAVLALSTLRPILTHWMGQPLKRCCW